MNSDNNLKDVTTRQITEAAVIIGIMVVFAFLGFYTFPIINTLYPIPAIIIGIRHNTKYTFLSVIASSILVGILIDILTGAFLAILFGPLAIILAYMIKKRYSSHQILFGSAAVYLLSIITVIFLLQYVTGISFIKQMESSFTAIIETQIKMMQEMKISNYELIQMKDILANMVNYIMAIIPAILIITSIFICYVNYWVSTILSKRFGEKTVQVPEFIHFKLPQNVILGTFVIILATLIIMYFKVFYYETVFLNIVLLLFFVFFIQGLAVVMYFVGRIKISGFIKALLILIVIIYMPFSLVTALLGFLDTTFNFRKMNRTN